MIKKIYTSQVIRFLFVGGTATLLQMGILFALVEAFAVPAVIASTAGYVLSSIYNYLANYYLTFSSTESHLGTFPKFVVVAAVGLASNATAMAIFLALGLFYIVAQVGATLVTLVLNFLLHKFWIYRSKHVP